MFTSQYKKKKQSNRKMSRKHEQAFHRQEIWMPNKYVKRCLTLMGTRETHIKITRRRRFMSTLLENIWKLDNTKYWWEYEAKGTLTYYSWGYKLIYLLWTILPLSNKDREGHALWSLYIYSTETHLYVHQKYRCS